MWHWTYSRSYWWSIVRLGAELFLFGKSYPLYEGPIWERHILVWNVLVCCKQSLSLWGVLSLCSSWGSPVYCLRFRLFLLLLFVALWFILWGDLFYVLLSVILFLCFSVLLALRFPRLGKRELILVLFVRLSDLCLFGFVSFPFLLVSGKGCGLWLWHSLDFCFSYIFSKK